MKFRFQLLLAGFLSISGMQPWLHCGEPVNPAAPVKIYDTVYDKEPGRTRWQLYPREHELVDVPDAPTIWQFADTTVPVPGWHEIIVQHPFLHQSVLLRFKIPGQLKRVVASQRTLQFWRVGGDRLEIRFLPNGKVFFEKITGFDAISSSS